MNPQVSVLDIFLYSLICVLQPILFIALACHLLLVSLNNVGTSDSDGATLGPTIYDNITQLSGACTILDVRQMAHSTNHLQYA